MEKLTIIIIARDEEKMLSDCLESASWADEVIVVDHGSIDKTINIAKAQKAKVINLPREDKPDYSHPRNVGLKAAKENWVFYLDADERITPKLKKELRELLKKGSCKYSFYAVPRLNIILGKPLKHGGWYPDYVKRLFNKSALKGWKGALHEEPVIKGKIGHLQNSLMHIKHETISEMIEKTNNWSKIEAKLMFEANHPKMNIPRFFTAMWREFFFRMIKKKAFLDGSEGVIMALYQVWSRFTSYAKLYEMQIKNEKG